VLNALYNFDRHTIGDWMCLMSDHLQRPDGAKAMRTARYTVDIIGHVETLRSATARLAAHGDPVARSLLADAALDLKDAVDRLYDARDALLKSIGADSVSDAE
jgi:N-acetylglucosamine kinase-like BadF-type ATPase